MSTIAPEKEYQMIREEIRAEHTLISNRLTWYVTSQSFLVTAFTISSGSTFAWHHWFPTLLLPAIGLLASALITPSIIGASVTIAMWQVKQRDFFKRNPDFSAAFHLHRESWIERRGLLFPRMMPLLFGAFWLVVHIASYFLHPGRPG